MVDHHGKWECSWCWSFNLCSCGVWGWELCSLRLGRWNCLQNRESSLFCHSSRMVLYFNPLNFIFEKLLPTKQLWRWKCFHSMSPGDIVKHHRKQEAHLQRTDEQENHRGETLLAHYRQRHQSDFLGMQMCSINATVPFGPYIIDLYRSSPNSQRI